MSTSNEINNHKLPSQAHTATGMGLAINAAKSTGEKINIPEFTTLNEHLDILAQESIGVQDGDQFYLRYFGIGIKGSKCIGENANGLEVRRANEHDPSDQNAFFAMPFLIREIEKDIDDDRRRFYRLRQIRKIGSKTYVLYWLKLINFELFKPSVKVGTKNEETGNEDQIPYVYKKGNLNPVPRELTSINSIPISNQYLAGTGTLDMSLDSKDLDEFKNVCRIMLGDASLAAINEIYMCYGRSTRHQGAIAQGGTVSYDEVVSAVMSYIITETYARDTNTNNRMPIRFEYGNSVPFVTQDLQIGKIINDANQG